MFNNFIKKTSKFFAVLLTATLAFTPLSYGAEVFTFTELKNAISDGSITTIDVGTDITADIGAGDLGSQASNNLTINGNSFTVNGNGNSGMSVGSGKTATITDVEFSLFAKNYYGGVLFNSGTSNIKDDVTFNSNTAGDGGAIYSSYGEITIGNDNTFVHNKATGVGGAIVNDGGEMTIGNNIVFSSNTANRSGGAIYTSWGDTYIGENASFNYNSALGVGEHGRGGAIYNDAGYLVIGKNINLSSNTAKTGGAIYNSAFITTVEDGGSFLYNSATEDGGAIYNKSDYNLPSGIVNGVAYLNLLAKENDMEFTGNTANGESNAIYDDHGTINLWAGDDKSIVFNDKIASAEQGVVRTTSTININSIIGIEYQTYEYIDGQWQIVTNVLQITESSGTGKIVLNEDMSGYKGNVNLYGGTLEMNADYDKNGYKFFDTEKFTVHAGTFTANASSMLHDFVNNGMTEFSGGTNEVAITGTGTLQITGEVENIEGTNIEQNELIVTETGSFSANVNDLSITNSQIQNAGDLIFVGTTDMTNDYVIDGISGESETKYGNLTVKGNLENNAAITQNNVTVESGLFTNNKTITANNLFTNEGETINLSTITAQNVVNSGTLTSNASDIVADSVFNEGEYNITGGTVSYKIKGGITNGTVNIKDGEVTLSADSYISQNNINLAATLNLGEDTSLRTSTLNIEDGAELNTINDKTRDIAAEAITIASGANWNWSFDMDLESLKADMLSNVNAESGSTANIKGINIIKDRDGEYFLQIADANINAVVDSDTIQLYTTTSEYTITADNREDSSWLQVVSGGAGGGLARAVYNGINLYSVTEDIDYVTEWIEDPEGVDNNFLKEDLTISGNGYVLTSTTGVTGIDVSTHSLTVENLAEFSGFENALTVQKTDSEEGNLNVSTVTFTGNTGTAVITNEGRTTLSNVTFEQNDVTADIANSGILIIDGTESTILENGISGQTGSTNVEKDATLVNGENSKTDQKMIEISGTLMNNNESEEAITSNDMYINTDGTLVTNASALAVVNEIANHGNIIFTGGTNENIILGGGELNVAGAVNNTEGKTINQSTITVTSEGKFTANVNDLNADIVNNGNLIFDTLGADMMVNDNKITGEGNLTIQNDLENNANIEQGKVIISVGATENNEDASIVTSGDGVEIAAGATLITHGLIDTYTNDGEIANEGTLEVAVSGDAQSANKITGNGELKISAGTFDNTEINGKQGSIEQKKVTIAENAVLTSSASLITTTDGIVNSGTLKLFDGTNSNEITGDTGKLEIAGNVINSADVTQKEVNVTGKLTNNETITATTFTNSGEITSKAEGILAEVSNSGIYNITGGSVTYNVTGNNTGNVNIREEEVTIKEGSYIEKNNINLGSILILEDEENNIKDSTLTIENGATLNSINNSTGAITTNGIKIAEGAQWNLQIDVDLAGESADNLINVSTDGSSQATISNLNILSDKAQMTSIQIADAYINATANPEIYTTNIRYKVTTREEDGKTYLDIEAYGYGGLPQAVYDAAEGYSLTEDFDYVTEWIEDPVGIRNNFLKENLKISGNDRVLTSTTGVSGIDVNTHTLEIEKLKEFSGFNNALTVSDGGSLVITNVIFKNNVGNAVITNEGKTTLSGVTFENNGVTTDILNDYSLLLTGDETVLDRGISGTGKTEIDVGTKVTNSETGKIEQSGILINGTLINKNINDDVIVTTDAMVIEEKGSLTTNANSVKTGSGITNNGELIFLGGTNNNEIGGNGNLTVEDSLINNANIKQNKVDVKAGIFENNQKLTTTGSEGLNIYEGATFIANNEIDTWSNGGQITNNGLLNITAEDVNNKNKIDGTGNLLISSGTTVHNEAGIKQTKITIEESAVFESTASIITANIKNDGILKFNSGLENDSNSNEINGIGQLVIENGTYIENTASIKQSTITIADADSVLTGDVNNIVATGKIANEGLLVYTGEGTNNNVIDGAGNLTIDGTIENSTGTAISQTAIAITSGNGFKTSANDITTEEGIENNGTLTFTGGTNNNEITML
ncbi:MAG: hypothetical protein IKN62_04515, partial [Elusimicrobia bacterium]|nr:hypothetical protein [Elusimicrobiota bacterium]